MKTKVIQIAICIIATVMLIGCNSHSNEPIKTVKDYRAEFLGNWTISGHGELTTEKSSEPWKIDFENKSLLIKSDPTDKMKVTFSGYYGNGTGNVMLDSKTDKPVLVLSSCQSSVTQNGILITIRIEHGPAKVNNGKLEWTDVELITTTNGKTTVTYTGTVECYGIK